MVRLASMLAVLSLFGACADTNSGFHCPQGSFSSDDCRARIASSGCKDGGVTAQGSADAGTQTLCCEWLDCTKDPYPEVSAGP